MSTNFDGSTMAPEMWDSADAVSEGGGAAGGYVQQHNQAIQPQQRHTSHEDQLDRQMLRHLMSKYTAEDLSRLMQEENTSTQPSHDAASIYTTSTYSSVRSDDSHSVFDSASSIRTISDTSSARGSIISNVSARTAKFLGRRSHIRTSATSKAQSQSVSPHSNGSTSSAAAPTEPCDAEGAEAGSGLTTNAAKQRGTFTCGFCKEEGIQKTCTRKNDLKRHIEDFHNMNAQWYCRQRGCGKVFDWQTVYKTHLKHAHGGSRMALDEARVDLCPQTIFACGFENCTQVLESPSDADAGSTFKEYVAHVVKHLDEGSNSGEWSYSTRIRNLMRQSGAVAAWSNSSWPEAERSLLTWEPQTSGILRKRLETRHLGDLHMLVQYAIALASDPESVQKAPEGLVVPVRSDCRMQLPGHDTVIQIQQQHPPQPSPPHHQGLSHPVQQQSPASDQFQFRISRGNGNNPQLANYYAQRRLAATRPPVRSGRSARPPSHAQGMPASPMAPHGFQQQQAPAPTMFDPMGYYESQAAQSMPQQQYPMMSAANGGVIADDIRSLHSIAGNSTGSADMDMADAQMMDSSAYMGQPQPVFGRYDSDPMPTPDSIKMEHYGNYGAQNGY